MKLEKLLSRVNYSVEKGDTNVEISEVVYNREVCHLLFQRQGRDCGVWSVEALFKGKVDGQCLEGRCHDQVAGVGFEPERRGCRDRPAGL